ncbi:MAG: SMC-Scp complex subunit ScpB [Patescibacteria group bacterium]
MNQTPHIQAGIESILFIAGEPVTLKKLATILRVTEKKVTEELELLATRYEKDPTSGLKLVFHKEAVILTTKPEQAALIELLTKETLQASLTKTQLEVLAIVAYRGPVSKPEIEAIRGVNCSFTLRNLLMRELIEREGNPSNLRGFVYTLSTQFLMTLGIASISELPDYSKLREDEKLTQALASTLTDITSSHES